MHRSYQSVKPCQNKLLQSRWDKYTYEEHRRKVASARPTIDSYAPRTYLHLHLKLKKLQLEEERLATVERDNRILLEKMSYIMRTQGRIDNKNDYECKSLNREKRERELLRITTENQGVLKRIMMRRPEYDHFKWQSEWDENQKYLDNISHYPREWWLQTEAGRKKYGSKSSRGREDESRQSSRQRARSENGTPRRSRRASEDSASDNKKKSKDGKKESKKKETKEEENEEVQD